MLRTAGAIKNVNIVSEDGRGKTGLSVTSGADLGGGNGPAYVENVAIYGFDYGINAVGVTKYNGRKTGEVGITYEYINLEYQNVAGVITGGYPQWFRVVSSDNTVPAFMHNEDGSLFLSDANLTGRSSSKSAIENEAMHNQGVMFFRNITTSGYKSALASAGSGSNVAEYAFPAPKNPGLISLNLQAPRQPEFWDSNLSNWKSVANYGGGCGTHDGRGDATFCIQRALDSGKEVVYFPLGAYHISSPLHLRNNALRLVYGADANVTYGSRVSGTIFQNDKSGSTPVEVRLFSTRDHGDYIQNGLAPFIINNVFGGQLSNISSGTGDIYLEDFAFPIVRLKLASTQHLYARQFDVESGPSLHMQVSGGTVWIFGFRTEGGGQIIDASNSTIEVMGSFGTQAQPTSNPLYEFRSSKNYPLNLSPTVLVNGPRLSSKTAPMSSGAAAGRDLHAVLVSAPPSPALPPNPKPLLPGGVTLQAMAADDIGIKSVAFIIDGAVYATVTHESRRRCVHNTVVL
jgi:hypothetical protein